MTWLEEVIDAFKQIGGEGHVQEVYEYIANNTSRELKTNWRASIRKVVELHSSDSKAFEGKEDLFESVNGINKGFWRLRTASTPVAPDRTELDDKYPDKILSSIYRFQRDTKMIGELKILYENRCQICDLQIKLKGRNYSEGHHLKPLGGDHKGPDNKNNILILCPNHHVEFDYGIIALVDDLLIKHVDSKNVINGKKIVSKHNLNAEYIKYHLENIYDH